MMMRTTTIALVLGTTLAVGTVLANHDHQGNSRVVQLAAQLSAQANECYRQATYYVRPGGWGSNWNDQRALQELGRFSQYAASLAQQASALEPGWGAGPRHHDDEQIGEQLEQLFHGTWQQADEVERYLYNSYALRPVRPAWDYQLCNTLRQLRAAIHGGSPWSVAREDRRTDLFTQLFPR